MVLTINVVADILFLALGLAYGGAALALPEAAFGDPRAPMVYPLIISGALIALSLLAFAGELRNQRAGKSEKKVSFKLAEEGKLVAFVSIGCLVYAFLFERIGYIPSTLLFLSGIMIYISKGKKLLAPLVVAVVFSVGVYFLFSRLLSIQLPPMPFLDIF